MKLIGKLWLLFFVAVVLMGVVQFSPSNIHTDIRALLPTSTDSASADKILAHSTQASRDIWVLVGSKTIERAAIAANIITQTLAQEGLQASQPSEAFDVKAFAKALLPYRGGFLSPDDQAFLAAAKDENLLRRSLALLYRPFAASFAPFQDDPLGTFENALLKSAAQSPFQFSGPCVSLRTSPDGLNYCALSIRSSESMGAVDDMPVTKALDTARQAVLAADSDARIHSAGVTLISEEAASTASSEATLIGAISAAAIILLVIIFFARVAPLLLTLVVLAASLIFAASSVVVLFGEVHILTLVFGATLLGICVDYVFHMLCATATGLSGPEAGAKLLKPLSLSLLTTGIGYAVMIFSPMPGLRQMAVFCIAGLMAAYCNMLFVAGSFLRADIPTRAAAAFSRGFAQLPRAKGIAKAAFVVCLLIVSVFGALQLKTQNELALLNRIPAHLMADMQFVGKALSPVSPGQLFVIQGNDTEAVLQAHELLQKHLAQLAANGVIGTAPNPTALLPSRKSQQQARTLTKPATHRALTLTEETLKSDFPAPSADDSLLTLSAFKTIAPQSLTHFWLSDTSLLVPLSGVTAESLPHLQKVADEINGVRFVNTTSEVADSLATYRNGVLYALLIALSVIGAILAFSMRRRFVDFWAPTALSIALTFGLCGFAGIPLSLFSVLPVVLVVGLGVDYAIVLYSEDNAVAARNSVFLAASSTLLAFGLLALSSTPALHIFGLTLLLAMASVLVTTVVLRPRN